MNKKRISGPRFCRTQPFVNQNDTTPPNPFVDTHAEPANESGGGGSSAYMFILLLLVFGVARRLGYKASRRIGK